jgi:hypothetical protein
MMIFPSSSWNSPTDNYRASRWHVGCRRPGAAKPFEHAVEGCHEVAELAVRHRPHARG